MDKLRKRRSIELVTNVIIIAMLVVMCGFAMNYNTKYTASTNQPIYHGDDESNNVSIMFNVYWGTEYIEGILNVLDRYGVKATFFIGGTWAEKNGELLREIYDRGHEIGNHGYFHKDHSRLDYKGNYNEIEPNNLLIEGIIGMRPQLFAPPSGAYNKNTLIASQDARMRTIMWTKDTIDWRDKDTNIIVKRATDGIKGGDLVLAHPTKCTLEALPHILEHYDIIHLKQVVVSENIGDMEY